MGLETALKNTEKNILQEKMYGFFCENSEFVSIALQR
jgi:hypothetical protein